MFFMLLGFVESKRQSPIWTYCKEKGKRIFKYVIWVKNPSRCQVVPTPKDMCIRTPLDNINKK